jgi:methionyl-tRNA formyltransferase
MLTKADGAIDFARPAAEVAARIRGVDPWPGAHARLRGEAVKLFRARAEPASAASASVQPSASRGDRSGAAVPGTGAPAGEASPGTVIAIDAAGAHVQCGDGAVVVRELQAPGRKRMAAAQFAAGRGIAVGDVLAVPA